ncbi:hypothetical protein D3C75_1316660 [compost metagenome]
MRLKQLIKGFKLQGCLRMAKLTLRLQNLQGPALQPLAELISVSIMEAMDIIELLAE